MFIVLLVLLYVMSANAIIVPTGCFVAMWTLVTIEALCAIINSIGGGKK